MDDLHHSEQPATMEDQDARSPSPPLPPPPQEQPDSKKLKMSTTTTTSDDEDRTTTTATEKKPRYKRRKVAILFAYCGVGYQGMQKNPGAKTIEGDLEEALYFSGAVPENDRGCPKRFDFARSARTDKGVSAVGQVVSGKFYVDPPGFVERLNNNLPSQFRVFGYKRVTASFSAKKFCDRRRYVYLLPVFALDPASHRDRESVLASLGSENELVKCLECSERGRKVFPVSPTGSEAENQSGISSNTLSASSDSGIKHENSTSLLNGNDHEGVLNSESVVFQDKSLESTTDSGKGCDNNPISKEENAVGNSVKGNEFVYGEKEKERFNKILRLYEGTHNFHNFTTRTKAEDPSAKRYIISFHANTTVTVEGLQFLKCEVVGQSFMLHQIRKMIGVAVAIMRNSAPESLIQTALQQDVRINVPTAPEVGLYLDECFFTSYNQKWKDTHEEVSMKSYAEEAEEFKLKHIYSHIASTEHKEGAVAVWLHSLNFRNYPDLGPDDTTGFDLNHFHPPDPPNQTANPRTITDPMLRLIASGRLCRRPIRLYDRPTVSDIDLDHLATAMKTRLNLVFPFIEKLRDCYNSDSETATTTAITDAVSTMVDTAMSVTYNRLRSVLRHHEPTVCTARMNPRAPLSNRYKFPTFISSLLSTIGPLRVTDGPEDMLIVYATSADKSRAYGRSEPFIFNSGRFFRFIDNLAEIGVPLAPIDVKTVDRGGSFFTTVLPNLSHRLWDFTSTFHYSNYKYEDFLRAWVALSDNPARRAFPDCSMQVECCTEPAVVNAVIAAARPENVPDGLYRATAPARPVGGVFNVNVFGVRPAEGGKPAAVYIVGRGGERYFCTSLARNLNEFELVSLLRNAIVNPSNSLLSSRCSV